MLRDVSVGRGLGGRLARPSCHRVDGWLAGVPAVQERGRLVAAPGVQTVTVAHSTMLAHSSTPLQNNEEQRDFGTACAVGSALLGGLCL